MAILEMVEIDSYNPLVEQFAERNLATSCFVWREVANLLPS